VKLLEEAIVENEFGLDVVQLGYAQRGRLAHIRVLVPKTLLERVCEVVDDLLRTETTHCSDRESTDERVRIVRVLHKCVHGEDDELGLSLGVVHEVKVDELLLLEIVGLHVLEHVGEETANILHLPIQRGPSL
jgi:hypothetical protein